MQDPPRKIQTFDASFGRLTANHESQNPSINYPEIP